MTDPMFGSMMYAVSQMDEDRGTAVAVSGGIQAPLVRRDIGWYDQNICINTAALDAVQFV